MTDHEWTEGVCGDGAAILRDGVMVPVEEVVATLDRYERALSRIVSHWREFGGMMVYNNATNRDDYENRQAGAASPQIEVTPEMVQVGYIELLEMDKEYIEPHNATDVFVAMLLAAPPVWFENLRNRILAAQSQDGTQ